MPEQDIERVMHQMPYGLYIVGSKEREAPAGAGDTVNGMMADWVMQVSFRPRLLTVAFENDAHTLRNIREHPFFTVNLLAADEESMELARGFAQPYAGAKIEGRTEAERERVHYKLDGLAHRLTANGVPVLDAGMAWLECLAADFIAIGDHTLVVGEVLDGRVEKEVEPMTSTFTGWVYSG